MRAALRRSWTQVPPFSFRSFCFFSFLFVLFSAGCSRAKQEAGAQAPTLADPPVLAEAFYGRMAETVPAYGVVGEDRRGRMRLSVNVGFMDAPNVKVGQSAVARQLPGGKPVPCRVADVMRDVNRETGESIVTLAPATMDGFIPWSFIYAEITTSVHEHVLLVPRSAVLVLKGLPVVVRAKGDAARRDFETVPVAVGRTSWDKAWIESGLKAGDRVLVQGALGYLYPGFASAGGD